MTRMHCSIGCGLQTSLIGLEADLGTPITIWGKEVTNVPIVRTVLGEPGWVRTIDPLIKSQMLYP